MSDLRVDQISNLSGTGAVSFSQGVVLSSTSAISNVVINAGVITATSFSGSGIGITNVTGLTNAKGIAVMGLV